MTIHARLITLAIAGLCASGAVGCEKSGVQAARQNTSDPTSKQILSMDDRDFLIGAEKAGIRQRTLAQQALQKSNNNEVREFARHVITDRSQALSELKRVMDAKQMKEQAALAVEVPALELRRKLPRIPKSEIMRNASYRHCRPIMTRLQISRRDSPQRRHNDLIFLTNRRGPELVSDLFAAALG